MKKRGIALIVSFLSGLAFYTGKKMNSSELIKVGNFSTIIPSWNITQPKPINNVSDEKTLKTEVESGSKIKINVTKHLSSDILKVNNKSESSSTKDKVTIFDFSSTIGTQVNNQLEDINKTIDYNDKSRIDVIKRPSSDSSKVSNKSESSSTKDKTTIFDFSSTIDTQVNKQLEDINKSVDYNDKSRIDVIKRPSNDSSKVSNKGESSSTKDKTTIFGFSSTIDTQVNKQLEDINKSIDYNDKSRIDVIKRPSNDSSKVSNKVN